MVGFAYWWSFIGGGSAINVHGEAGLGGELQATVDAPVIPGRPLLAGPLHVDPLLLLGEHLQAAVDAVPEGLLHWQEVLKTGIVTFKLCLFGEGEGGKGGKRERIGRIKRRGKVSKKKKEREESEEKREERNKREAREEREKREEKQDREKKT